MPVYRDGQGKLRVDGVVAIIYSIIVAATMLATGAGSYYSMKAMTHYRLDKAEANDVRIEANLKALDDKFTNHAMNESGTQQKICDIKESVAKIEEKLDKLVPVVQATRDSQRLRFGGQGLSK